MRLEQLFQDKDQWKKDTINLIKRNLLTIKGNETEQPEHIKETHFVCVYGKSQVGKTTLILNLIGLKEECKKDVSRVLRGGVKKGNSSTSTAILYSQSINNKYGIQIETLDGRTSEDTEYFSSDQMIMKLKSIRESVEKNKYTASKVVHLFLPNNYFLPTNKEHSLLILDLPGIESNNILEKIHVENLMTRYLPISSICIITTLANTIQSLEKDIELPNCADWKNQPNKYYVAITKAYSDGNIKKYFATPRKKRSESFFDFVNNRFKKELLNILGNSNSTKIFPLDLGESFESLLTNDLKNNKEDCNEILNTRNLILSDLQESLASSKGEQLLSVINDLRQFIDRSQKNRIDELTSYKKSKESELINCREKIDLLTKDVTTYNDGVNNTKSEIAKLKSLIKEGKKSVEENVSSFSFELTRSLKETINKYNLTECINKEYFFVDKDRKLIKCLFDYVNKGYIESILNDARTKLIPNGIELDLYQHDLANYIYNEFRVKYENILYPPIENIIKTGWKKIKQLCGSTDGKVTYKSVSKYIDSIPNIVNDAFKTQLFDICITKVNELIEENKKTKEIQEAIIQKRKRKIKEHEQRISKLSNNINKIQSEINNLGILLTQDKHTLDTYMELAHQAYINQRNAIIEKINSPICAEDKTLYLFLLGVIDQDFKAINNMSNEFIK